MDKVSIIVPVYNVEDYLKQCIESVLNQSYREWELILVDDGSTDQSGIICDDYAKKDSRITVIHQKNLGVSAARNKGMVLASGEYLSFLDSDDWLDNNFIENAIYICNLNKVDVFASGYKIISNKTIRATVKKSFLKKSSDLNEYDWVNLLLFNYISRPCAKLYRRSILKSITFDESMNFGEDLKFLFELLQNDILFYACNEAYYNYRNTPNSLTKQVSVIKCNSAIITYKILFNKISECRFSEEGIYAQYIDERWQNDFLDLENAILKSNKSIRMKFKMLKILTIDKKMTKNLKANGDKYLRRYATHPLRVLLYNKYKSLGKK